MARSKTYFKWTPEADERLRQLAGTMPGVELAVLLGCAHGSLRSHMSDLGIKSRNRAAQLTALDKAKVFMDRFHVSRDAVDRVGVEHLNRMSEDAQALMLRWRDKPYKRTPRPLKRVVTPKLPIDPSVRPRRMLELAERIALLRRQLRKVS